MPKEKPIVHPFMPNSIPAIKEEMLKEIGVPDVVRFLNKFECL